MSSNYEHNWPMRTRSRYVLDCRTRLTLVLALFRNGWKRLQVFLLLFSSFLTVHRAERKTEPNANLGSTLHHVWLSSPFVFITRAARRCESNGWWESRKRERKTPCSRTSLAARVMKMTGNKSGTIYKNEKKFGIFRWRLTVGTSI